MGRDLLLKNVLLVHRFFFFIRVYYKYMSVSSRKGIRGAHEGCVTISILIAWFETLNPF